MSNDSPVNDGSKIRTQAKAAADEIQRRLIADAVCEIVAVEGLEAATFRRTARELECTTGLISHYFTSKEGLLNHALQHATRLMSETSDADLALRSAVTIDDYIKSFCHSLPLTPERTRYWRVLAAFRSAALTNEGLAVYFADYRSEQSAHWRARLAAEVGRQPDDELVVKLDQSLNALLEGFGLTATERPERHTPESVYRAVSVALQAWIEELA